MESFDFNREGRAGRPTIQESNNQNNSKKASVVRVAIVQLVLHMKSC